MRHSTSETRADNIERRLIDRGIMYALRRGRDGLTRVWHVDGQTMTTGQVEKWLNRA